MISLCAMSETPRTHRTDQNDVLATVVLAAPSERVWNCLVDPRELVRWFPLEAQIDPRLGGKLVTGWSKQGFHGEAEISAFQPGERLELFVELPFGNEQRRVVQDFRLEESGPDQTTLRLAHTGFGEGPAAEEFSRAVERGWSFELFGLQHYLAHHFGTDREVVYAQVDLDGTRQEAWKNLLGDNGPFVEGEPRRGETVNVALTSEYFDAQVVELWPGEGLSAVVEELGQAYFRVLLDVSPESPEQTRMSLWLSTYGLGQARRDELEQAFEGGLFALS
jgi:uncharacterized protein YndB with AHSA1/START domain